MIKALISDADGTLVNTVYLIRHGQYEAAAAYLQELGIAHHEIPPYETYESYINKSVGGPTRETLERTLRLLFGQTHKDLLDRVDFDALDSRLKPVQDHIAPLYVHPFHGLTELFNWLGETAIGFGIYTSGNRHMIVRNFGVSLPVLGYTDLFQKTDIAVGEQFNAFLARAKAVYGMHKFHVVTCDDVTQTKPDPEGILRLMDDLGVQSDEVISLGDHAVDVEAARRAGIHAVGISHGFGTPAELTEAGAVQVIDNLLELPKLIEKHNTGEKKLW